MDHALQTILRNKMLEPLEKVVGELPLINPVNEVYDEHISSGKTGWQIYGSRKPVKGGIKYEAYKITQLWEMTYSEDGWEYEQISRKELMSEKNYLSTLKEISARNPVAKNFDLKDEIVETYERQKKVMTKKRRIKKKGGGGGANTMMSDDNFLIGLSQNKQMLYNQFLNIVDDVSAKNMRKAMIGEHSGSNGEGDYSGPLDIDEYYIYETHKFVMALPEKYYTDYESWLHVGWALKNTAPIKLFPTWIEFSSQWGKFNYDCVEERLKEWLEWNHDGDGYNMASIRYWLKNDDEETYNEINSKTTNYYVNNTLGPTAGEWDYALLLHKLFGNLFVYTSKKSGWYKFEKHRWVHVGDSMDLDELISTKVLRLYEKRNKDVKKKMNDVMSIIGEIKDDETKQDDCLEYQNKLKELTNRSKALVKCCKTLKDDGKKSKILNQCKVLFRNREFFEKLDANEWLMGFTNGVVDFKTGIFREGRSDDYISMSTGIPYIKYNGAKHGKTLKKIETFLHQLFPEDELYNYMWEHLASVLIGMVINQTFTIYNGSGRNGKSKLVELMDQCLGEYKGTLPITLVTSKRSVIGKATPEVADLKGLRYAVMQEPSKNEKIQEGVLKELTGGDKLQARKLYAEPVTFTPQFSLAVCTNHLFTIDTTDEGTWRRIHVVEFKSKFVDNPSPKPEDFQFKVDRNLKENFEKWAPVFMSKLVELAIKTKGVIKECSSVMAKSKEYRDEQDHIGTFIDECIVRDGSDNMINKAIVNAQYDGWYRKNFAGGGRRKEAPREIHKVIDRLFGEQIVFEGMKGWKGLAIKPDMGDTPNDLMDDDDY